MRAFSLFLLSLKLDQKSLFKHYYFFVGGEGGRVGERVGGWVGERVYGWYWNEWSDGWLGKKQTEQWMKKIRITHFMNMNFL